MSPLRSAHARYRGRVIAGRLDEGARERRGCRGKATRATIGGDVYRDGACAGGLTDDCNTRCVTAEEVDLVLYPFEREPLIENPRVGRKVPFETRAAKKP